jgi:hypothetical protein
MYEPIYMHPTSTATNSYMFVLRTVRVFFCRCSSPISCWFATCFSWVNFFSNCFNLRVVGFFQCCWTVTCMQSQLIAAQPQLPAHPHCGFHIQTMLASVHCTV